MSNIEYEATETQGLTGWDKIKDKAGDFLEIGEGYASSQVANEKNTADYNAAIVMGMKQDTENRRVLVGQLSMGLLIIISAIVVVVIIKAWKR